MVGPIIDAWTTTQPLPQCQLLFWAGQHVFAATYWLRKRFCDKLKNKTPKPNWALLKAVWTCEDHVWRVAYWHIGKNRKWTLHQEAFWLVQPRPTHNGGAGIKCLSLGSACFSSFFKNLFIRICFFDSITFFLLRQQLPFRGRRTKESRPKRWSTWTKISVMGSIWTETGCIKSVYRPFQGNLSSVSRNSIR